MEQSQIMFKHLNLQEDLVELEAEDAAAADKCINFCWENEMTAKINYGKQKCWMDNDRHFSLNCIVSILI